MNIDKIIAEQKRKGLEYEAGKFRISKTDAEHFILAFELYFTDQNNKYHQVSNMSHQMNVRDLSADRKSAMVTGKGNKDIVN